VSKILDAMDALPARERTCLVEVHLEGRTVQAVAKELGNSPDAVRMNVHRARACLRSFIE
jgi:RNA polymerase sigma factor (sigma-70 family)